MPKVTEVPVPDTPSSRADAAQVLVAEVRAMRDRVPDLVIPDSKGATQKLVSVASVPPQFVELTAVAVTNSEALVRKGGADAAQLRDLLRYADAYEPFADELEALAQFVRHSVVTARHKAGTEALATYAIAQRLAKLPETADLAPHVADMRRALGKRGRSSKAKTAPVPPVTPPSPTTPAK
ncbi:MAG TPA: hypothetical protein VN380_24800 [Thermoanaerobaculia bacterium]|jgi:hypothetical protein|nr:hypothetical protein [Thermoanaerobaculia bacterium]